VKRKVLQTVSWNVWLKGIIASGEKKKVRLEERLLLLLLLLL